uniref:Myotubularin-related protein 13 n=1 Tax=Schistosoma mansoni TaxID=6183 RepID=A0A5K4FFU9_SCHMA
MLRLVDYAAVVGYDFEKSVGGESEGQVLQRFPTNCWDDYPYNFKIETFCQPCGWYLSRSKPPPTFFVAYLTDVNGNPYFAACLTFHEAVSPSQLINLKIPPHIPHSRVRPTGNAFGSYSQNGPINNGSFVVNKNKTFLPTSNSVSNNEKYQIDSLIYVTNVNSNASSPVNSPTGFKDQVLNYSGLKSIYSDTDDPNLVRPPEFYAPKCLVFLARHQHFDVLKNNLSLLYTVFADSLHQYSIEQMIATLLGGIEVPPTGGPRITFSLGVGDRQIIQPAHCSTIPVTRNCVALLFKHLGIHNVILLFTAILSDQKVLVCSRSLNRLTEACHALTSILYPLKYSHTYVPILPKSLIEFINAPTPFLYGIHTGYQHLLSDMVDVFVTDLDGGSVVCPENIPIPQLPDPYFTEVVENLFQILSPELMTADYIYPLVTSNQSSDLISLDKRLRAVFLRLFTSLFAGYRSCLTITRIHPKPVIHFNRTLYLLLRGNSAHNEFYDRLLSSMRFHQFILERGPPFRVCDIFDEVYESNVDDYSLFDNNNNNGTLNNRDYEYDVFSNNNNPSQMISGNTTNFSLIERLSTKLFDNEFGDQPATQILPNEAVEAHKRIHQTPFPVLDAKLIDELTVQYSQRKTKNVVYHKPEPRFVPQGLQLDRQIFKAEMFPDKYRVIHEFVDDIFNQHITEALKRRNTIRQDLKSRPMRRLFVDELRSYIIPETSVSPTVAINNFFGNMTINRSTYERRAVLTWEQFELIVDLLDEALRQETQSKDSGITPIIMDISTRLCTELGDVRYYANMSHQIQRHEIWRNMPFWESLFNEQVNNQIRLLYIDFCEEEQKSHKYQQGNQHQHPHTMNLSNGHAWSSSSSPSDSSTKQSINSPEKNDKSSVIIVGRKNNNNNNQKSNITIPQQSYTSNMSALEIAAEEMRIGHMRPREVQQLLETREESTVYSQIIHFVNLIINFRIPVHIGAAVADIYGEDTQNNDNNDGLNVNATGINGMVAKIPDVIISDNDNYNNNNKNNNTNDHNYRKQYTGSTNSLNNLPVTSQINHALKTISQTEGYVKNTSRYLADNYSNNQSNSEGSYGRYSGQNVDKSNQIKLLNHITVLENWLLKFVKIVGEENNLIRKRITEVEGKIKAIIESHLINLQDIYPKVQNIPHMKKPEIANPVLLPGEIAIPIGGYDCLSCQLLPDGRYERNDYQLLDPFNSNIMNSNGGHGNDSNDNSSTKQQDSLGNLDASDLDVDLMLRPLLPAQGALFITNYRIIFTGVPKDPFQSNKVINRSFPISALYTIKKLGCVQMVTAFQSSSANPSSLTTITSGFRSATLFVGKKSKSNTVFGKSTALRPTYSATTNRHCVVYRTENLDVLLLRSLTFQMLKIGFDVGEIQPETRDELRNLLEELRYPSMMCMGFNSAPLGLLFPRSTNVVGNRTTPTDLNNNTGSNTKDYILPNMVRMRHLKGKTHKSNMLTDANYSSITNGDRRRTHSNQQFVNSENKTMIYQSSSHSPKNHRYSQLNAVYAEEAAANLAATLKAFLVPPSLSASSTASTIVDPNFIRLLTQSSGYLDMARFDGNFNPGITTGATVLGAATSTLTVPSNNVSVGLNENGSGSLNRSSVGAGSSGDGGSRVYCSARLVAFNVHHSLVKSYPSFLIIPQGITQNCLAKVARSHRRGRFPVVTWQHPETKAYLLRGSEIQSNVILNTFKNIKASSKNNTGDYDDNADSTLSHSTVSKEHIRYIRALIDMSMSAINSSRPSSVITSETGYLATDELSNSSQLPIVSNSTTVASSKIPSTDNLSKEFKPIINKPSPVVSNVTNNRTKFKKHKVRDALGRIGKFAARRNRLTRSGVSPMGSVTSGLDEDLLSMDSASQTNQHHARQSIHESSFPGISSGISNSHKPCLYILCEKQMTKMSKIFNSSSVVLSPIDYPTTSAVTKSFKGFFKACLPNDSNRSKTATKLLSAAASTATGVSYDHTNTTTNIGSTSNNSHYHRGVNATLGGHFTRHQNESYSSHDNISNGGETIETENIATSNVADANNSKYMNVFTEAHENGWFIQLKSLLELAGTVVDLLDLQGASVALCLENGSDVVAQIVSLVQIMLDPYYRTITGFWSLIDKEWLLFGHTFNHNSNQTLDTKSNQYSPIFLQFLDIVHQLLKQFPLSFEFNDYYIQFIAYHHISNRFYNFKYDTELERFTKWFPKLIEYLINNLKYGTSILSNIDENLLKLYNTHSIWTFIQQQHYEWPIFYNFRYSSKLSEKVLRPTTHLAAFDLWKFYLTEDLACGSIYDLDHFSPSYRKNTNRPYEPVLRQGFNNSHIEQTYAVLGLREGEEAVGWQEAWEQAQSELLNLYSSSPRKHLISKNDKSTANTQSTSNIPGSIVDTSTSTTNATSSSNTNGKTNTHVKIVHHFNQLPYRESSEPIESLSHHKLVTSDYSMTKRRAVSSGLLDTNQTNSGLLSSLTTTSSSTTYPLTNELTQTLTPQGGSNGSIDLDSTFVNCSEIITTSSIPVSERHSNDTTQSQLIIVKNPTMKDNSESHLSTDMNPPSTNSTTITVRTIKGSNHSKTEEILKSSDDRIINGTETKTRTTNNGTTDNNFNVIKTNYNGNNISKSEQVSEDEAFHEDNDYIYGDRYDSVGESSVDDYHFTRHAILEYHRATTLKRLTRRTAGGIVIGSNIGVESNCQNHHQLMPDYSSLDTDLSPGYRDLTIEYESDSVNSLTGTGGGLGSTMLHSTVRIDDFDINAPLQDELQHHPHRFTSSPITNNTNVQCELCQKICQSSDDIVKCIECDLLCHTKCSLSINSKCFKSSVTNNLNQINKTGNLLTRHGSAYLPNEVDNGKLKQSNDTEKSSLNFGIAGAGGSLFNSTLPWRTERDHTFRSSLVLIHDKRGKRKLSESSSSLAHTNTSDCQSQSGQSLSGGGGGSTTIEHHLPEHLASASYYGYLYKLGHRKFLQQWKQRLFALDTNRHQLKYYESYANASPRGCIDLQDVRTVRIIKNFAIQRKSPSFVVFELETNNRTYKLGAINQESAMQWIERIQKTIQ